MSAVDVESQTHMFTVGLDYRFNWDAGGTVVARF
jgi:hypothetical protein